MRRPGKEAKVSDLRLQLRDYRLTTAEIIYHLPDHPDLLQSFIWQHLDIAPEYPNLRRFLDFWEKNIEGKLHSVRVGQKRLVGPARFRHVKTSHLLH
jgi:uncharacterized protein Usg